MEQGGLAHHHGDTSSFCLQMLTFVDHGQSIDTSPKENKGRKCKNQCLDALKIAADYVTACIKNTYEDPERVNYAVNFEAELPFLMQRISQK